MNGVPAQKHNWYQKNKVISINPQEIYLLERYSSLEYFAELRDTWEKMVSHVEACLADFMRNLPTDYRSQPLPEQPDIVWVERVLPNFRDTFRGLCSGFVMLSHGDAAGLHFAHGPRNDFKGQMDYWSGWMSGADEQRYGALLNAAVTMASNICATEGAYWLPYSLSKYSEQHGPLNPPGRWPMYRIDKNVSVATGGKTPISGIYIPDVTESCAEFLSSKYKEAPAAIVFIGMADLPHPITGEKYGEAPRFETRSCVWHLVERELKLDRAPPPVDLGTAQAHVCRQEAHVPRPDSTLRPPGLNHGEFFRKVT